MLAAAVCPNPPLLVPEVAQGAATEIHALRSACDTAVRHLLSAAPDRIVVLGAGLSGALDESAGGSFSAYGLDVCAGQGEGLPLSLTIGAWLLDRAEWDGPRLYTSEAFVPGAREALLVMADGSAKRSTAAPGYFDERAEPHDAAIASALAAGNSEALASLDLDLAVDLWAAGVPALRILGEMTKDATITVHLRSDEAPYGVGYWVAEWTFS